MVGSSRFRYKRAVGGILLGQFLSLLITSTGFTSSELARKGINAPTSQSFLNYVLLALAYGIMLLYRRKAFKVDFDSPRGPYVRMLLFGFWLAFNIYPWLYIGETKGHLLCKYVVLVSLSICQAKWYYYILLGLIDVEANYLVVKAYQYTSLTSVMLLDCWTIPCVLILTRIFLKTKYRFKKIIGVVICIAGVVMVVFSDVSSEDRAAGSAPVKGDLLVIAGATLYGFSNVAEEYLVKNADRVELMAMLGLFGGIISACQVSILERTELRSIHWSAGAALPFVGFSVAMFLFYSLVPILLKVNGSAMLNLSLLSSDMWAVLIRVFLYHEKVDWLYYLAFAAVAVGLVIYSWGDRDGEAQKRRDEEANAEDVGVETSEDNPVSQASGNVDGHNNKGYVV